VLKAFISFFGILLATRNKKAFNEKFIEGF